MTTEQNATVSMADEQLDNVSGGEAGATALTVSGRPVARIPMRSVTNKGARQCRSRMTQSQ